MNKFNYDDIVIVKKLAPSEFRPDSKAWVVGIFEERPGPYFDKFPKGIVYSVEFEDGGSVEIHESLLEAFVDEVDGDCEKNSGGSTRD